MPNKNLKDSLIKSLEKKKKNLELNLKKITENFATEKSNILTKIEVVDLQLSGLKGKK